MSFERRLVGAVAVVTLVALGGAMATISLVVNGDQERELDDALRAAARAEAAEAARTGPAMAISDRPGPAANDTGPLTKYAVVYDAWGRVLASTDTFRGRPPPLAAIDRAHPGGFDLWFGSDPLRGVLVPVPGRPGYRLLLAAPRIDLDGDEALLARAMTIVFIVGVLWAVLVASWIVHRLTRDHQAIAAVARRVAGGDFAARIQSHSSDRELAQLAADLDGMIERLGVLVTSQQQFIAHAAHELRSPLTTLYGELSLALRRSRSAEEYRQAIEEALASTRQLKLLAEDLLELARLGQAPSATREAVVPAEVIKAAVEAVRPMAKEHEVEIVVRVVDAEIVGRPRDLVRLLRNLLENAVQHSPRCGRVEVTARPDREVLTVTVADGGPGVPAADRERIFDPFFRGSRERAAASGNAGLGLAIARGIARSHGGEVELVPTHGEGSGACFAVHLPLFRGWPAGGEPGAGRARHLLDA